MTCVDLFCLMIGSTVPFTDTYKCTRWSRVPRGENTLRSALMSRAPFPLTGPALWDHLRDEALSHRDLVGEYPVSNSEEEFVAHVDEFCAMTLVSNTSVVEFSNNGCVIRGEFIPRWSPLGVEDSPHIVVTVTKTPLGEIHLTSDVPPMFLLHTNVFVRQFSGEWATNSLA